MSDAGAWRRTAVVLGLAVSLAGFGTLVVAGVLADRTGGSIDPTDPANFNAFVLSNDSASGRYFRRCADVSCRRLDDHDDWLRLDPGTSTDEQVWWGSDEPVTYAVSATTGGSSSWMCLRLSAPTRAPGVTVVYFSAATTCANGS